MLSVDFRETPIKAVAEDSDGYTIYCGNGSGDLSSIDIRTGILDLTAEKRKASCLFMFAQSSSIQVM